MIAKLMGMASAQGNVVAALGQPIHMDGSGNSDSFFKARQSNAGFRASVFANPMVPHALSWLCLSALSLIYLGSPKPIVNLRKLRQPHGVVLLFFFITLKPEEG